MNICSKCQLNGVVFVNLQTFRKMPDCKRSNDYETDGSYSLDIKLNIPKEIPYLRFRLCYSLSKHFRHEA